MALESYGVGATFLFTMFLQISYGLRADLKLRFLICRDVFQTIFTGIIKWYIQNDTRDIVLEICKQWVTFLSRSFSSMS
jgi:hypothetical protein